MKATNHNFFSLFSLEILGDKGRCDINENDNKIIFYKINKSLVYEGYKFLNKSRNYFLIVNDSMNNLVSDCFISFSHNKSDPDSFVNSLVNIKVLEAIRKSENKDGIWINL